MMLKATHPGPRRVPRTTSESVVDRISMLGLELQPQVMESLKGVVP